MFLDKVETRQTWLNISRQPAPSLTFSSPEASPLPLVLVGLLIALFLSVEARRYRFFDFWRIRAHILELHLFGPILRGEGVRLDNGWNQTLYQDYLRPTLHISFLDAVGRRLRRNYGWIFLIQATSYVGKLLIHPEPVPNFHQFLARATIGPIPGGYVLAAGLAFRCTWIIIALATFAFGRRGRRPPPTSEHRDAVLEASAVRFLVARSLCQCPRASWRLTDFATLRFPASTVTNTYSTRWESALSPNSAKRRACKTARSVAGAGAALVAKKSTRSSSFGNSMCARDGREGGSRSSAVTPI